jgi:hypothetical protein
MLSYDDANRLFEYDYKTGELYWKINVAKNVKSGMVAGKSRKRDLYKTVTIKRKQYQAHRIVWLIVNGNMPKEFIDHINGDRTDNRIFNLREATHSLNAQNVRKPSKANTSGYLGVSFKRGAYESSLTFAGKSIYLGRYDDPKIAHQAYINAKRKHHIGCTL